MKYFTKVFRIFNMFVLRFWLPLSLNLNATNVSLPGIVVDCHNSIRNSEIWQCRIGIGISIAILALASVSALASALAVHCIALVVPVCTDDCGDGSAEYQSVSQSGK